MKDWREIALQNQATLADLHKRRTAAEHRQIMRGLESAQKQRQNAAKQASSAKEYRYWRRRAKATEALLRRFAVAPKPAAGPTFYESTAWRTLRYKALKLHGAKCQLCGATETKLHVDHIKPRSKYPELELRLDNLQVLCAECNLGKGAWDESDWRKGALKSIPG